MNSPDNGTFRTITDTFEKRSYGHFMARGTQLYCKRLSPTTANVGWICTRELGHLGDHIAHVRAEDACAIWSDIDLDLIVDEGL